jgi:hypothetical protein
VQGKWEGEAGHKGREEQGWSQSLNQKPLQLAKGLAKHHVRDTVLHERVGWLAS